MKISIKPILVASILPLAGLFAVGAQADFVDLFQDGFQTVSDVENGISTTDADNTFSEVGPYSNTILGGYRDIKVDTISGGLDNVALDSNGQLAAVGSIDPITQLAILADGICQTGDKCTTMTVSTVENTVTLDNDTSVNGVGTIQWDGDDNSSALTIGDTINENFITQDGCGAGCDRFNIEVIAADHGFIFTVGIYTDADNWTEFDLVSSGDTGIKTFLFSDFTSAFLCGADFSGVDSISAMRCGGTVTSTGTGDQTVDFTKVNAMQLIFNVGGGSTAIDLSIGPLTKSVPEPGVLALFGLGLAAVGFTRRRRGPALSA